MWRFKAVVIGLLGVCMLGELTQAYALTAEKDKKLRSVSGEIAYVNVKLGEVVLEGEATKNRRYPTEFRINQQATNVTDPTDKLFLGLKDLRVGQHVTVEFNWVEGEWKKPAIALKITAFPMPEPILRETTGELEVIDVQTGMLVIEQRPLASEGGEGNLLYFIFEPKDVVFMSAPDTQPVQLELKQGDIVKVGFVVQDGRRYARFITLLSAAPETTSTTTTTTTSTTIRKIIVEPVPTPVAQEATGELEAIDGEAGTLFIEQKPLTGEVGKASLLYFVFEPKDVIVMKAPDTQSVRLQLNPGDIVKVGFEVRDGKRHASSITLLSAAPETTSTTTTTMTNTTVTQ